MKEKNLTPEESLQLISNVINEARNRFIEDGIIYMFWGGLLFLTAMAQFLLLKAGKFDINYYPYFIVPLGYIFTHYYYRKKDKGTSKNSISKIIQYLWITIGINIIILSFCFPMILTVNLIPINLILSGIGIIISGAALREKIILIAGIISVIAGYICFLIEPNTQPLVMSLTALFSYFGTGLLLYNKQKKWNTKS